MLVYKCMSSSFSDLKLVFQCSIFLGMFVPSELCEVLETDEAGAEDSGPVKYQCLDCLALFDSPDVWLEHRNSHSRSSTHSKMVTAVRTAHMPMLYSAAHMSVFYSFVFRKTKAQCNMMMKHVSLPWPVKFLFSSLL